MASPNIGYATLQVIPSMQGVQARLASELGAAGAAAGAAAGRQAGASMSAAMGASLAAAGRGLTLGLTVPLAGAAVAVGRAAIDFESAFAGVRKTVDATEAEFAALEDGIRSMAERLPASAVQIAAVAEAAGQLGIETDAILGFTEVMIGLGEATNLSATEAATALARMANITQLPQDQFDRLGSTIVDLGNNLATTEAEIVEFGLRLAGAGQQIGLTEAEILGLGGALSSLGINAEAGGTAFSRVMLTINTAVMEGGDTLRSFANVAGLSVDEFARLFREDAAGAIVAFVEGLGTAGAEGANLAEILDSLALSDIRVRDALLRSAGAGDLLAESIGLANRAWEENTALQNEVQRRYETTASQLAIFRNRITEIAITVGSALLPILLEMLGLLDPVVDLIGRGADAFAAASPQVQRIAAAIAGAAAALGPFLWTVGRLLPILGALTSPITLVVAAVAAIGVAFWRAYQTSEPFRAAIDGLVDRFTRFARGLRDDVAVAVREVFGWLEENGPRILAQVDEWNRRVFEWLADNVPQALRAVRDGAVTAFGWLQDNVVPILERIAEVSIRVFGWLRDNVPPAAAAVRAAVVAAFGWLQANVPRALAAVRTGIDRVLPVLEALGRGSARLVEWLRAHWQQIALIVAGAFAPILAGIAVAVARFEHVREAFRSFMGSVLEVVRAAIDGLRPIIEDMVTWWQENWDNIRATLERIMTVVATFRAVVIGVIAGLVAVAAAIWNRFGDQITAVVVAAVEFITRTLGNLWEVVSGIVGLVLALINGDWAQAWDQASRIVEAIIDQILAIVRYGWEQLRALVISLGRVLLDAGRYAWSFLVTAVTEGIETVIRFHVELPGRLVRALGNVLSVLYDKGKDFIQGLLNGLEAAVSDVADWLRELPDRIIGWIGNGLSILYQFGRNLVQGIVNGIRSMGSAIADAIADAIPGGSTIRGVVSGVVSRVSRGFAGGVENFAGGVALVGEEGPELVRLPPGSSVLPANASARLLDEMRDGLGGNRVALHIEHWHAAPGQDLPAAFAAANFAMAATA